VLQYVAEETDLRVARVFASVTCHVAVMSAVCCCCSDGNSLLQRCKQCVAVVSHTATHCTTRQHNTTRCNTLQHTATRCNTLQHTATQWCQLSVAVLPAAGSEVYVHNICIRENSVLLAQHALHVRKSVAATHSVAVGVYTLCVYIL